MYIQHRTRACLAPNINRHFELKEKKTEKWLDKIELDGAGFSFLSFCLSYEYDTYSLVRSFVRSFVRSLLIRARFYISSFIWMLRTVHVAFVCVFVDLRLGICVNDVMWSKVWYLCLPIRVLVRCVCVCVFEWPFFSRCACDGVSVQAHSNRLEDRRREKRQRIEMQPQKNRIQNENSSLCIQLNAPYFRKHSCVSRKCESIWNMYENSYVNDESTRCVPD